MPSAETPDHLNKTLDRLATFSTAEAGSPRAGDGLIAMARRFHDMDWRDLEPEPDARFLDRLERELMQASPRPGASRRPLPLSQASLHRREESPDSERGHDEGVLLPFSQHWERGLGSEGGLRRPRRIDLRGLSYLAAAAMILLTMAAGLAAYRLLPLSGPLSTPSIPAMGGSATPSTTAVTNAGPVGLPKLVWKRDVGTYRFAPVVADNRVFVFERNPNGNQAELAALNLATGDTIWSTPLMHVYDLVGPTVANERVYVMTGQALVALSETTGAQEWTYSIEDRTLPPVVADGLIFVLANDYTLRAIDAKTGKDAWRVPVPGAIQTGKGAPFNPFMAPVVADGLVYAVGAHGQVFAVNATNGHQRWVFDTGSSLMLNSLVAEGVFVATALMPAPSSVRLFALDAMTGKSRWAPIALDGESNIGAGGGAIYVATTSLMQQAPLVAFDLQTGHRRWTYQSSAGLFGHPVIVDGQLYITSWSDGTIRRIDAKTGKLDWNVYLAAADPAVADGLLLAFGNGTLYAVSGSGPATAAKAAVTAVDLSGLPACRAPRPAPTGPITGTPNATIPNPAMLPTGFTGEFIDGRPNGQTVWPQILFSNVPTGPAASAVDVSAIKQTLLSMIPCVERPEARRIIQGFFTDDFFRRDIATAATNGYQMVWSQPDVPAIKSLHAIVLPDGRIAAEVLEGSKSGLLAIFKQQGGHWQIDEAYLIVPTIQTGG